MRRGSEAEGFYLIMRFATGHGEPTEVIAGPYDSVEAAFSATEAQRDYDRGYHSCTMEVVDARGNMSRLVGHPLAVNEMEDWERRQTQEKKRGR